MAVIRPPPRHSLPGHTGGDSIVLIPDSKIIFAGDLLGRNILPSLSDASTEPWIDTLDTLLATSEPGHTFVPGHGDVANASDVAAFRDYLMTLRALVAEAQAQGKSGDAVVDTVMPALREKCGHWDFSEYRARENLLQTDAELSGTKRIPTVAPE